MKKIMAMIVMVGMIFVNSANAHQAVRMSPLYYGGSYVVGYDYGLSNKTALSVGYSHLSANETGSISSYVDLYSVSLKWALFSPIGNGMYLKMGGAKVETNLFDSIPYFGSILSGAASTYFPYLIAGYDFKFAKSWNMSLELGTDVAFMNISYQF